MVRSVDVASRIREEIASGGIAFGERLRIGDLTARYGVSAMPIREAFRQLSGEGFIVLAPRRSARVRTVGRHYLQQLFDVHVSVEVVLARSAAATWRRADTEAVLEIHDDLVLAVEKSDADEVLSLNRAFHRYIYQRSNNPEAFATIDRHWLFMAALWKRYGYSEERFAGVLSDHWHIIKALDENDVLSVGTLVGAHVIKARQHLMDVVGRSEPNAVAKPVPARLSGAAGG